MSSRDQRDAFQGARTTTPLGANQVWDSGLQVCEGYSALVVAAYADADYTLYIQFSSVDGNDPVWDSTISFNGVADSNEVHRITVTRPFFKIMVACGDTPMTELRVSTLGGDFVQLTSALNSSVTQDADATTVRNIDPELAIARGLFTGYSIINKFGRNPDIDSGVSLPEDVWNGGGVYAGFPTTAPEEFEAFSSNAGDTGVVTFTYLASNTATAYQTATVTLNGTTPVSTGVVGYRMHTARYESGTTTTFNLGEITIRHKDTTSNVFCKMPIGRSQSNVAAYTVPRGSTGYIKRLFCRVIGATTGTVDGALWIRTNGDSPRLRRPFSAAQQDHFEEYPYGGLVIEQNSDIIVRIIGASTNNLEVIAGYDLVLIKN